MHRPPAVVVVTTSHTATVLILVPVVEVIDLVRVFQMGRGGQVSGKVQVLVACQGCREEMVLVSLAWNRFNEIIVVVGTRDVKHGAGIPNTGLRVESSDMLSRMMSFR